MAYMCKGRGQGYGMHDNGGAVVLEDPFSLKGRLKSGKGKTRKAEGHSFLLKYRSLAAWCFSSFDPCQLDEKMTAQYHVHRIG